MSVSDHLLNLTFLLMDAVEWAVRAVFASVWFYGVWCMIKTLWGGK